MSLRWTCTWGLHLNAFSSSHERSWKRSILLSENSKRGNPRPRPFWLLSPPFLDPTPLKPLNRSCFKSANARPTQCCSSLPFLAGTHADKVRFSPIQKPVARRLIEVFIEFSVSLGKVRLEVKRATVKQLSLLAQSVGDSDLDLKALILSKLQATQLSCDASIVALRGAGVIDP